MTDEAAPQERITALLLELGRGDERAADVLVPLVFEELRRIASRQLRREAVGHTLTPTALVHEAYLRLVDQTRVQWINRAQFFAVAARLMRRVLMDHARRVGAAKRGGGWQRLDFEHAEVPVEERAAELIALDDALERLAALNPRLSQVVECRFFGGMTEEETAAALGLTDRTVRRDWVKAKGWLHQELASLQDPEAS
jgi:RNA polymerase sigma factor (TIGR02999 family)